MDKGLSSAVANLELAASAPTSREESEGGGLPALEAALASSLALASATSSGSSADEAKAALDAALSARLELARGLFAATRYEEAVEQALAVVKADATWQEGAGKGLCVTFFEALGPDHPVAKQGRRRLTNFLFR